MITTIARTRVTLRVDGELSLIIHFRTKIVLVFGCEVYHLPPTILCVSESTMSLHIHAIFLRQISSIHTKGSVLNSPKGRSRRSANDTLGPSPRLSGTEGDRGVCAHPLDILMTDDREAVSRHTH